jgi:hypothetical protein
MVETIGALVERFMPSLKVGMSTVKYGCVVLSCMFVNRDNGES